MTFFHFVDVGFWRDLLNHILSSVIFSMHVVHPKLGAAIQLRV